MQGVEESSEGVWSKPEALLDAWLCRTECAVDAEEGEATMLCVRGDRGRLRGGPCTPDTGGAQTPPCVGETKSITLNTPVSLRSVADVVHVCVDGVARGGRGEGGSGSGGSALRGSPCTPDTGGRPAPPCVGEAKLITLNTPVLVRSDADVPNVCVNGVARGGRGTGGRDSSGSALRGGLCPPDTGGAHSPPCVGETIFITLNTPMYLRSVADGGNVCVSGVVRGGRGRSGRGNGGSALRGGRCTRARSGGKAARCLYPTMSMTLFPMLLPAKALLQRKRV